MKINSIQNIINSNYNPNFKTNYTTKPKAYSNDTFSFCAKEKYPCSDAFLETFKKNPKLKNFVIKSCILDENKKYNKDYESEFLAIYTSLKQNKSLNADDEIIAKSIALSLKTARKDEAEEFLPYFLSSYQGLLQYGFSADEAEKIFNLENFDVYMPQAFSILNGIFKGDMPFNSMHFFISTYCKNKDNLTDYERIPQLSALYHSISANDVYELDKFYKLTLDENGNYNPVKADFVTKSVQKILSECLEDENSRTIFITNKEDATNMMADTLRSVITSNEKTNGKFDIQSADESFDVWFKYVLDNEKTLNKTLLIPVKTKSGKQQKSVTINEFEKSYPNFATLFNNIFYRLYSTTTNLSSSIH